MGVYEEIQQALQQARVTRENSLPRLNFVKTVEEIREAAQLTAARWRRWAKALGATIERVKERLADPAFFLNAANHELISLDRGFLCASPERMVERCEYEARKYEAIARHLTLDDATLFKSYTLYPLSIEEIMLFDWPGEAKPKET